MTRVDELLVREFVCARCEQKGAKVERLSMSGTGLSRLFEIQHYRYAFVSCTNVATPKYITCGRSKARMIWGCL